MITDVIIAGFATLYLTAAWSTGTIFAPARVWAMDNLLPHGGVRGFVYKWQSCTFCMSFLIAQVIYWIHTSALADDWSWSIDLFIPAFAAGAISAMWPSPTGEQS